MFKRKLDEGNKGEDIAAEYLKDNGFVIIERNFRIRGGEIDIIATKDNILVFVEVKTRTSTQFGTGFEAITPWKLKALIKASQFFKMSHKNLPDQMRIDAISVLLTRDDSLKNLEHMENITG